MKKTNKISHALIFFLMLITISIFANPSNNEMSWSRIEVMGSLLSDKKLKYDENVEFRHNLSQEKYEMTRFEGSLGYQTFSTVSVWSGYNWIALENPSNLEFRFWQQTLWDAFENQSLHLTARTRIEQRDLMSQSQWSWRLRERLTLKLPKKLSNRYTPVIYNEVFFFLNNPEWINSNGPVDQNRIFLGMDIPVAPKAVLEVGYLNRYRVRLPTNVDDDIFYFIIYFNV